MSQVSVIIPCYNYAHLLRACVESVLTQSGVDVRVLIIDDCSPDDTSQVAAQIVAEDSRVEYRRHEVNRRHIATYNEGFEWASGDCTLLLSADDMLAPGALARATAVLDAHPDVGLVYGRAIKFRSGEPLPVPRNPTGNPRLTIRPGLQWLEDRCRDGWCSPNHRLISPEALMRTSVRKAIGDFWPELPIAGDCELWMRFAVHSDVAYIHDADQAYYRVHGANMHIKVKQDPLLEVRQRTAAFETIFREQGDRIPDLPRLRDLAYRKLADDAVSTGCEMFDDRLIESDALSQFVEFAKATYYHSGRARNYLGIQARQVLGRRAFPLLRSLCSLFRHRTPDRLSPPVPTTI